MANDNSRDEQGPPNSTSMPQWVDVTSRVKHYDVAGANTMSNPSTSMPLSQPSAGFESMANVSYFQTSQNANSLDESREKDNSKPTQFVPYSNFPGRGDLTLDHGGSNECVTVNGNSALSSQPEPFGSFENSGGQTHLLHPTNNLMTNAAQPNTPQKLDGSFLRLGMESPTEALSRCSISGRNIGRNISSDNNQMAAFPPSNTCNTQSGGNSLNLSTNMDGGISGFRNNEDLFSLVRHHVDGWTFPSSSQRVMSGVSTEHDSNSNSIAQTPQHDERHHLFTPQIIGSPNEVFGIVYNNCYMPIPASSQGSQVVMPNSMQSRATSAGLLSNSHFVAQTLQNEGTRQFSMPSNRSTPQIVGNHDVRFASSVCNNDFQDRSNISILQRSSQVGVNDPRWSSATSVSSRRTSATSVVVPPTMTRNNSLQDQSGEPFATNEGRAMQFSERSQQIPYTNVNTISQSGRLLDGSSLKRGSPESSQATFQSRRRRRTTSADLSISTPVQSASPVRNFPESASATGQVHPAPSVQHQANSTSLQPLLQTAPMRYFMPQIAQSIQPQRGASVLPTQPRFIQSPPQRWIAPPFPPQIWPARPLQLQPGHVPVVPVYPGPAVALPPRLGNAQFFPTHPQSTAPLQHPNRPHGPIQPQMARRRPPRPQATTRGWRPPSNQTLREWHPPTNQVFEIKWEDPDKKPQPLGHKCYLCKRDLSFTEEGPAYMPVRPPPVAVLPCGHTFHELCLQRITPESEAADPPCIPCATGES